MEVANIRLLRLFKGAGAGLLKGEFRIVSLDELPAPYVACSYCWGDNPTPKDKVWMSDTEYLNVTSSARTILCWILDEVTMGGEGWI